LGSSAAQKLAGGLSMTGGTLSGTALTLAGNMTATSNSGGHSALVNGNLSLGGATRTVTVTHGAATEDLIISAVISNSAGKGLTKAGNGLLTLSGTNTYTGTTTINAG